MSDQRWHRHLPDRVLESISQCPTCRLLNFPNGRRIIMDFLESDKTNIISQPFYRRIVHIKAISDQQWFSSTELVWNEQGGEVKKKWTLIWLWSEEKTTTNAAPEKRGKKKKSNSRDSQKELENQRNSNWIVRKYRTNLVILHCNIVWFYYLVHF
jgi:hypothetical protein